ncbi:unnamed protein product [Brugia timori]|uniref:Chromo domain-containing protein n=1 Tax=Brugia timori TaxID=42155 RepID=A0A0R3RC51_9BILA|nr:unnamed protein product [Brugia timori]
MESEIEFISEIFFVLLEKEKANQSEADLIEDMNQMFLNDDDEEEDDDRPGPSRLYYRTGDGGKPKRLYRM